MPPPSPPRTCDVHCGIWQSGTTHPPASQDPSQEGMGSGDSPPRRGGPKGRGGLRFAATRLGIGLAVGLLFAVHTAGAEPIKPVPMRTDIDWAKAELGQRLFHDTRLSKDNSISCASCHDLQAGGDDGQVVSTGIEGRQGLLNAPTVFNAGFNFKQFWDGRAHTLPDQADGPIQNNLEMGSLWPDVVTKLYQDDEYPGLFDQVYADREREARISRETVKEAIAEFVDSLTTPNSRFDRWLAGDPNALSAHEQEGYALFKRYGCVSCHQGANVGGNMFQVFGVINDYFKKRGNITEADLGRFNVTGNVADRHAFKVPSLRMAAHTAPYLHDGNAKTLREAVDIMFEFQLGREAPDEDKDAIVAFIESLAGEYVDMNTQLESIQATATQGSSDQEEALTPAVPRSSGKGGRPATVAAPRSSGKGGRPAAASAPRSSGKGGRPAAPARGSRGKGGGPVRNSATAVAQGDR